MKRVLEAGEIVRLVLSCRVFGLGAETNLGRAATVIALSQTQPARGLILPTPWIEVESWDLV